MNTDETFYRKYRKFLLTHGFRPASSLPDGITFRKNDGSGYTVALWNDYAFVDFYDEPVAASNGARYYPYRHVRPDILVQIAAGPSDAILRAFANLDAEKALGALE